MLSLCVFEFNFRILEYEKPHLSENGKSTEYRFELWDCGGDQK